MSRYEEITRGLIEVLEGVPGIKSVIDHEPKQVDVTPAGYLLMDRGSSKIKGGLQIDETRMLFRVLVAWQENEYAEQQMRLMRDAVPAALFSDMGMTLGGRITNGIASLDDAEDAIQAVFVLVGGVLFRALDFYIKVVDKNPRPE
jgi:hypothetical protein